MRKDSISYKKISEILYQKDPIGIGNGGNSNEYDPEAKSIFERVDSKLTVDQIHKIVYEEFIRWFGKDTVGEFDKYKTIAQEISKIIEA